MGAGFLLSLLGFGKNFFSGVGNFVTNNWKWLVPVALVFAGYLYVQHEIKVAHNTGYTEGVNYEIKRQQAQVDFENKKNHEFEATITNAITSFGKNVAQETADRTVKESALKNKVETIIKENPIYKECKVDQQVLDTRNKIRAQGPVITLNLDDVPEHRNDQ